MSEHRRVSPEEARDLLTEGYVYVDVRSEPEFERGHVPGAFNVPFAHAGSGGLTPNADFLSVMQAAFDRSAKLLIGCQSGSRSLKAARLLAEAGFGNLVELSTGWEGSRDPFGRKEPGWRQKGLPVETGIPAAQSYAAVKTRTAPGG
jgi:rhodanese-related sulfurtransferase